MTDGTHLTIVDAPANDGPDIGEQIEMLLTEIHDASGRCGQLGFVNGSISVALASHFNISTADAVQHFLDWRNAGE